MRLIEHYVPQIAEMLARDTLRQNPHGNAEELRNHFTSILSRVELPPEIVEAWTQKVDPGIFPTGISPT